MSDTYTGQPAPAHQEFHWIEGLAQGTPYADFLELTLDIATGIYVSEQIAYSSEMERAANTDAEPGEMVTPALGIVETDQLRRFSIAAARLLQAEARRRVEEINGFEELAT